MTKENSLNITKNYSLELSSAPLKELIQFNSTEVGRVLCKDEIAALIILDDNYLAECNMRHALTIQVNSKDTSYLICISSNLMSKLQARDSIAFFILYHEVGHIHYKHLETSESRETLRRNRRSAVQNGNAVQTELEADYFAALMRSPKAAIRALKKLQADRLSFDFHRINNMEETKFAYLEYEYRIKALRDTFSISDPSTIHSKKLL